MSRENNILSLYRGTQPYSFKDNELKFQTLSWEKEDVVNDDDDYEIKKRLVIRTCGLTRNGQSVALEITNFQPYFYLKIPNEWSRNKIQSIKIKIKDLARYCVDKSKSSYDWGADINFEVCSLKKLYYFDNSKEYVYLKINFKTDGARWELMKILFEKENPRIGPEEILIQETRNLGTRNAPIRLQVYESRIDTIIRFLHIVNIIPTGILKIKSSKLRRFITKTNSQICYSVKWTDIEKCDEEWIAPFRVSSFDIECTSADGSFPMAERKEDEIIQIGTTTRIYGNDNCILRHVVTLKQCNEIDDVYSVEPKKLRKVLKKILNRDVATIISSYLDEYVVVESVDTEAKLLKVWTKHIQEIDPDIMIGYNIFGFDWKYLYDRADLLKCTNHFSKLGRITGKSCKLLNKNLSSSAMGYNELHYPLLNGRVQVDLLPVIRTSYSLSSYKLDNVADHFMGLRKNDLPPHKIFSNYHEGKPDNIKLIAEYCIQDCVLVNNLFDKLCIFVNNVGMSNVCLVPFGTLFTSGQGIKVFSLITKTCLENKTAFPTLVKPDYANDGQIGYEGAIVLDPDPGFYYEPIAVLDFGSLYPSCDIEYNISYETYVEKGKNDDLKNTRYNKISYDVFNDDKKKIGEKECVYAEKSKKGIVPTLLIDVLSARKKAKKEMAKEKDPFKKAVLNGRQLALKITANSVYGYLGAKFSDLRFVPAAASITAVGRHRIISARDYTLENYKGSRVIYGDSVAPDTPLLLRKENGNITIKSINQLVLDWEDAPIDKTGKQHKVPDETFEVWTEQGWTEVQNVMKHKVNKKMYRVLTHTGLVDVTEDHSLLSKECKEVTPRDLKIGSELLHSYPKHKSTTELFFNENQFKYKNKINAMNDYDKLIRNGCSVEIDIDKDYIILLIVNNIKNPCQIKKIIKLPNGKYREVYDLTTKNHHFHAGVGQLIVHNTDSIFINLSNCKEVKGKEGKEALNESIKLGQVIATDITSKLRAPQVLEYEKTFWPFMIITKKRYAGNKYEFSDKKFNFTGMGLVTKRRDNSPIVKKIYKETLDIMFASTNIKEAIKKALKCYKNHIKDLLDGNVDIDDLIISKTLKNDYKNPTQITHRVLAQRMTDRDPGNAPSYNDRIPYIFIDPAHIKCNMCARKINVNKCKCKKCMNLFCVTHLTRHSNNCEPRCRMCFSYETVNVCNTCGGGYCSRHRIGHSCGNINQKILQGDQVENPKYIQEHRIKIDYRYYFEHQIKKPISQIFDLIKELNGVNPLEDLVRSDNNRINKNRSITDFFLTT